MKSKESEETEQWIFSLKFHEAVEVLIIPDGGPTQAWIITRVPNGWIYQNENTMQGIFIPFNITHE